MSPISRRSYTDEFKHQVVTLAESLGSAAAAGERAQSPAGGKCHLADGAENQKKAAAFFAGESK